MKKLLFLFYFILTLYPLISAGQTDTIILKSIIKEFESKNFLKLSTGDTLFITIEDSSLNQVKYYFNNGQVVRTNKITVCDSTRGLNGCLRVYYRKNRPNIIDFSLMNYSQYNGYIKVIKENGEYLIKDIRFVKRDD